MKKIQYVKLVGLLTILLFLNISCKDDDTLLRGSGITEQSWSTNQTYFASAEQTLTFTFTTLSSWTAQNSSTALLSLDNTVQSPNQKIPDRKTKCVIKTHINIKQNVIFGAKLKPV